MPIPFRETYSALVPFAVARQCCAPVNWRNASSNLFVCCPVPRYHLPLRKVYCRACSSNSPEIGQLGKASLRTLGPPSRAGLAAPFTAFAAGSDAASEEVAALSAGVLLRNDRLVQGIKFDCPKSSYTNFELLARTRTFWVNIALQRRKGGLGWREDRFEVSACIQF